MSDGEQREGIIELSRGTEFQLTNLKRVDTGDDAPVESAKFSGGKSKIYTFNFNVVKEMRFSPHKEDYLKKFKILNVSFIDEVDEDGKSLVKKVRVGLPYPVIKPKCTVVFNSGEVVTGVLNTRVVYLTTVDPDTGFKIKTSKIIVKSKYSGEPGQSYEDLVRVKHIQMLDEGTQFARNMPITFNAFDFDSIDTNYVRIKDAGDTNLLAHGVVTEEAFLKENKGVASTNGKPATAEAQPYTHDRTDARYLIEGACSAGGRWHRQGSFNPRRECVSGCANQRQVGGQLAGRGHGAHGAYSSRSKKNSRKHWIIITNENSLGLSRRKTVERFSPWYGFAEISRTRSTPWRGR